MTYKKESTNNLIIAPHVNYSEKKKGKMKIYFVMSIHQEPNLCKYQTYELFPLPVKMGH